MLNKTCIIFIQNLFYFILRVCVRFFLHTLVCDLEKDHNLVANGRHYNYLLSLIIVKLVDLVAL